ncbi:hypothetical protein PBI_EDMUNDO_36 [Arthrobacter phage Edmundo]|nr:hypothetical protein PBI_EDMUNDO_36 [Arthrobacter phage Edmundo]
MTPRKGPIGHLLTAVVSFTGWLIIASLDHRQKQREQAERNARDKAAAIRAQLHAGCKCGRV